MCLLSVTHGVVPGMPLSVAANRDERRARPTVPMTRLEGAGTSLAILGGRDEVGGGTWLATNEAGVVAGLTNPPPPDGPDTAKRSRGEPPLAPAPDSTAAGAPPAHPPPRPPGARRTRGATGDGTRPPTSGPPPPPSEPPAASSCSMIPAGLPAQPAATFLGNAVTVAGVTTRRQGATDGVGLLH